MIRILGYSLLLGLLTVLFLLFRLIQRLYYRFKGHRVYSWTYSPRKELNDLLRKYEVLSSIHQLKSSKDGTKLRYRRLGKGERVFLLANGVGTDFFMWLPLFRFLLPLYPTLFHEITLLVPDYRGLFVDNDEDFAKKVEITVELCLQDIQDILKHSQLQTKGLSGIIGWSTGAQIGLAYAVKYPKEVKSLMLFNPSVGKTLHYALQPFTPLPPFLRKHISIAMTEGIGLLKPLIPTIVWDRLKAFNDSFYFHIFLTLLALFGGFPPDQPVFFHEYMRDAFKTRSHTRSLLNLILSLDEELSKDIFQIPHYTVIFSGTPDFLTGVYHSKQLIQSLRKSKWINFSMGSHFLLIEWPEIIAKEVLEYVTKEF